MLVRSAQKGDLMAIVRMLANDTLGRMREDFRDPLPTSYAEAFARITADDNQELVVVEDDQGQIVGTLQLTFIPYLTYRGGIRAQIEAVRIRKDKRGQGMGELLFKWAIARARVRRAHIVQLTTDKLRPAALKFYEKLGFKASHEGLKMHLS